MNVNFQLLLILAFVVSFSSLSFAFALDVPTNFKAEPVGDGKIKLTWTHSPSSSSDQLGRYWLQHKWLGGGSFSSNGTVVVPSHENFHTYENLTNGTEYEFRIEARHGTFGTHSGWSDKITMISGIPRAPTLTVTPGDGEVQLSWTVLNDTGSAITSYKIQYKLTSDNSWTPLNPRTGTGTTETIPGLTNEQSHDFRVRAVNTHGDGLWSDSQSTTPIGKPDAPVLTVTASNTQVSLTWTEPDDNGSPITDYQVRYALDDNNNNWNEEVSSGDDDRNHIFRNLTNGTSYIFQVRAINAINPGPWSSSESATPTAGSIPDPPRSIKVTPADGRVLLTWVAPSYTGSNSVMHYIIEYREKNTSSWTEVIDSESPGPIGSLTNNKTYEFRMYTVNTDNNKSNPSEIFLAIPSEDGPPEPPTNITATPGYKEVKLTWDEPIPSNLDGDIHRYSVRYILASASDKSDGNWSKKTDISANARETTVDSLTNGAKYEFQMRASVSKLDDGVLRVQEGSWSSPSVTATPIDKPGVPTNLVAEPDDATVKLSWTAPSGTVTDYKIEYSTDKNTWLPFPHGDNTVTSTVTGLINGTEYHFRVSAINTTVEGDPAEVSSTPLARAAPSVPTSLTAERGDTEVTLTWTVPPSNPDIIDYLIIQSPDDNDNDGDGNEKLHPVPVADVTDNGDGTVSYTVTGLVNGRVYTFNVTAKNTIGSSQPSSDITATPVTTPGAPNALNATANGNDGEVELSWTAPNNSGGSSPTDGYKISYTPSGGSTVQHSTNHSGTSITIINLVNGTTYTFDVQAFNDVGDGGTASASATPSTTPSAPTLTVTRGNTTVGLSWTASNDNGAPILDYIARYKLSTSNSWIPESSGKNDLTHKFDNLTNGTSYDFQVGARNTHGTTWSSTESATPATTPGAPTNLTATRGSNSQEIDLTWTAPTGVNTGGSPITDYDIQYSSNNGTSWNGFSYTGTTPSATVDNLTNGTAYIFQVRAVNAVGTGSWSANSNSATPATTPNAPTNLQITPGNTVMNLEWVAPTNNGGDAITDYLIQYRPDGGSWSTFPHGDDTVTSTVTNLINGTEYDFRVYAVNRVGQGATPITETGTVGTVPDPPTNLSVVTYFDKGVLLSWVNTPPANNGGFPISSYKIIVKDSSNNLLSTVSPATSPQFIHELTPGQEYKFEVLAVNSRGNSNPSNQVSAIPFTQPDPPRNLAVTSVNSGTVTLSWDAPSYYGDAPPSDYTLTVTNTSNNTSQYIPIPHHITEYTVMGLENSVKYSFSLTSSNARASSGLASVSSNNELATPGLKPGPVSSLSLYEGNGTVTLLWTPPTYEGLTPIVDYRIQRYSGDVLIAPEHIVAVGGINGLQISAPNDFVIKYVIQAQNSHGYGPSVSVEGTPWERYPPGRITDFTATPGINTIQLSWSPPNSDPPIINYDLYVWCPGYEHMKHHRISSNSTSYTLYNLESGKTCTISILANNRDAPGPTTKIQATPLIIQDSEVEPSNSEQVEQSNSEEITSQQTPTIPAAPTNLVATPGDGQVELSWNAPSNNGGLPILDYIVEYRSDSTWIRWNDGTGINTSTIINLTDGTYSFRVFAVNSVGSSIDYSITSATIESSSEILEPTNLLATPGNGQVTLTWDVLNTSIIQYSDDGTNWITFDDNTNDTTSIVTGLINNTQYYFRVSNSMVTAIPSDIFTSDNKIGIILDDYTIHPTLEQFDNLPFIPTIFNGDSINGVKALYNVGIDIIIGPSGFDSTYINQNDIIYISYNSTSPEFALKDNIIRFTPSDDNLGIILAKLLQDDQINHTIIHRDGTWGELMYESLNLDASTISYSANSPNYDSIIEQLQYNQPNTIILLGFEETNEIIKQAITHDIDATWYLSHFDDSTKLLTNVNYIVPIAQTPIDISDILLILGEAIKMDTPLVESIYAAANNAATLNEYGDLGFIKYDIYQMNNGNLINTATLGISNISNTLNVVAFIDSDDDKIYDKDEIMLPNIMITVTDLEGNEYTKYTDSFGIATFEDLTSQSYTISGHYNSEAISVPASTTLYDVYLAFN